jgi:hypothetical protein
MNKEKWVEEILQSGKAIQPLLPDAYMVLRIEAKLQAPTQANILPLRWVYASAAVLLVLLVMNVSILRRDKQPMPGSSAVQQMIQEYGWGNNDLYSMNLSNRQHE